LFWQKTANSEMGQWLSVRCGNLEPPMSQMGHKLALPHCNILSRFTPISRHNPKAASSGQTPAQLMTAILSRAAGK
jgi:hypothetical protein